LIIGIRLQCSGSSQLLVIVSVDERLILEVDVQRLLDHVRRTDAATREDWEHKEDDRGLAPPEATLCKLIANETKFEPAEELYSLAREAPRVSCTFDRSGAGAVQAPENLLVD